VARRKGRKLFWTGAALVLVGGLGRLAARMVIQENPELYMGAMMAGLFETMGHLTLPERAVILLAYYGLHLALAGAVLAFFGLIRGR